MMALLFLLQLLCVLLAWNGQRKPSIYLFIITLLLMLAWFSHHMTSTLNIQL